VLAQRKSGLKTGKNEAKSRLGKTEQGNEAIAKTADTEKGGSWGFEGRDANTTKRREKPLRILGEKQSSWWKDQALKKKRTIRERRSAGLRELGKTVCRRVSPKSKKGGKNSKSEKRREKCSNKREK